MQLNGLRIACATLLFGGLLAGTFLAGNLSAGDNPGSGSGPPNSAAFEPPAGTVQDETLSPQLPDADAFSATPEEPASPAPAAEDGPLVSTGAPSSGPITVVSEQPVILDQPPSPQPTPAQSDPVPPAAPADPPQSPNPTTTPVVATPTATQVPATPTPAPPTPTPTPVPPTPAPANDAPYVVMVSPIDDAIGIAPDATIVMRFSEPMDRDSVEFAFSISTGKCGAFIWNSDSTQFTFDPCYEWDYGANVDAGMHKVAADLLGLEMAEGFEVSFRVLRQATWKIYSEADRDGYVFWNGYASADAGILYVSRVSRGFLSFDLNMLPANLMEIQAATVHVRQQDSMLGAYGPKTGNLLIESLTYGTLGSSDYYTPPYQLRPKICLGNAPTSKVFSANPLDGWKSADMLTAVRADWQERVTRDHRSQFRLRWEKECPSGCTDVIALSLDAGGTLYAPYLLVTYTYP